MTGLGKHGLMSGVDNNNIANFLPFCTNILGMYITILGN
jgi:hypothetical protein